MRLAVYCAILALPPSCADDARIGHRLTQPGDPRRHRYVLARLLRAQAAAAVFGAMQDSSVVKGARPCAGEKGYVLSPPQKVPHAGRAVASRAPIPFARKERSA